jgi:hypothetical protein
MLHRLNLGTRLLLQHRFNSMHLYCRMCIFMPPALAIRLTKVYERFVHRLIYR